MKKPKTSLLQIRLDENLNARFAAICKEQRTTKTDALTNMIRAFCEGAARFETQAENHEKRLKALETELAQLRLQLPTDGKIGGLPQGDLPDGVVRVKERPRGGRKDYAIRDGGKWQPLSKTQFDELNPSKFNILDGERERLFFPK